MAALAVLPFFVLGLRTRVMAALLAIFLAGMLPWAPVRSTIGGAWLVLVTLLHAFVPGKPFLSLDARGRVDPAGGFQVPEWTFLGAWCGLVAAPLTGFAGGLLAVKGLLVVLLVFAFFFRRLRLHGWLLSLTFWIVSLAILDAEWVGTGIIVLHLLAFEPAWLRPRASGDAPDLVFFDGTCGICHGSVRLVLAEDREGTVAIFAPLGGPTFLERLPAAVRSSLPDSLVVLAASGRLLTRSSAVVRLAARLGGVWRIASFLLWLVPKPLRDFAYAALARSRRVLAKRPAEACPMMPQELRARFRA